MFPKTPTTSAVAFLMHWWLMGTAAAGPVGIEITPPEATPPGEAKSESPAQPADAKEEAEAQPAGTPSREEAPADVTKTSTPAVVEGVSFESLKPELLKKWNQIDSFTAKVTTLAIFGPPGERFSRRGDARYDYMKKNGEEHVRVIENNLHTIPRDGADGTSLETVDTIVDGEFAYVLVGRGDQHRAMKFKAGQAPVMRLGGPRYVELLSKNYDIRVLPDGQVNGRAVYVLEATPKRGSKKIYHYVDRKTGMALKTAVAMNEADSATTVTVSDIKFGVTFADDRFKFEPPPGVAVLDRTEPPKPALEVPSPPTEPAKPAPNEAPSTDAGGSDD